jgi:phenylacetate-CoA ligase
VLEALRSSVDGLDWPAVPNQAGGAMLSALFQLERSQWLSPSELWALQRRQLAALLRHAAAHVPYYRERIPAGSVRHAGDFSAADFSGLPRLNRAGIQDHFKQLCAERLPDGQGAAAQSTTSGSTGEPVRFLSTPLVSFFWHAFMLREHLWHRRDLSAKMVVTRVSPEKSTLDNWFGDMGAELFRTGRCVILPARWTFERQLDCILEERPGYLLAYATNLLGLLRTAERRGAPLPWLREVRSFGEAVPAEMRDYIARQWRLPLTDVYSARETGYMALQCPQSGSYHVQSESAMVEVVDEHGAASEPGTVGRIVVTPLHNFAMPLIRYEIGDYAEVGPPCACGRGLPVLRRILGRTRNILRLPDGSMRWPTLGTEGMLDAAPVRRVKVIQKSLTDIEVRLIALRPFSDGEFAALREHFLAHFGPHFNWRFVFLDEFPPEPGDKFEDFVSEVA